MIKTIQTLAGAEDGFTLIELLMVILIIAILVLVGLPAFLGQQEKAKKSEAQQNLRVAYSTARAESVFNAGLFPSAASIEAAISSHEPQLADEIASGALNVFGVSGNSLTIRYTDGSGIDVRLIAVNGAVSFTGL